MQMKRFFVAASLSLVVAEVFAGCAAPEPLTGQALFADVAKHDRNPNVCETALEKLTDQAMLADVAKNAKFTFIRFAAAERLDEQHQAVAQATYTDIAKNDSNWDARRMALQKLAELTPKTQEK